MIDPIIFGAVVETLMFSERGAAYWAGLRRLQDTCEADFGAPLDPALNMQAVRTPTLKRVR